MNGTLLKILFLSLFLVKILIKLSLDLINYSHLKKNAGVVPVELKNLIDQEKLTRINSYNVAKIKFRLIYFLINSLILLLFLFSPLYSAYTLWLASFPIPFLLKGLCFFLILNLIAWVLDLPFDYYFHFHIESRYEFNQFTIGRWIVDEIKNILISSVLTTVILSIVFGILQENFVFSWRLVFSGWALSLILVLIFMYLMPLILIPLYYKLKTLDDQDLQQKITELITKSGFKVRGVFMADESKKSSHANAMITGIGRSKTIILFDTLLNNYNNEEILAIIAHEIGHGKRKHIFKLMGLVIIELFLFILFASGLLASYLLYQAVGISKILYSGAFFAYVLFFDLLSFFVQPIFSWISRALEYEADHFSKELLGSGEPLKSSFRKFITNELENINPHPWYEAFYYSHPTLLKRIKALES